MKIILFLSAAIFSIGVAAHPANRVHYHTDNGEVKYANSFEPLTETTYETDNLGRRIRVDTTTTCSDIRVNPRNKHLRCLNENVDVTHTVVSDNTNRPSIAPIVYTAFERDSRGRTVKVTTTYTCSDSRWFNNNGRREAGCWNWERSVKRDVQGIDRPTVEPVVYRQVERDNQGRRVIVTTTYTCTDARWSPDRSEALCFNWSQRVDRELVRRRPRDNSSDLNGDGQTEAWEQLILESFRQILDN